LRQLIRAAIRSSMVSQRGLTSERKARGFTLIELLVVISIIGILSAVVLASLNTARKKGNDAAIQSNLVGIQVQAEIYYGTSGNSYGVLGTGTCPSSGSGTVFHDPTIIKAISSTDSVNGSPTPSSGTGSGTVKCNSTAQTYAIYAYLTGQSGYWCVDSTGTSKFESTYSNGITSCP
jgi:type IV pilus assembly protein PilA